jgi:hypothetical protein
MKRKKKGRRKLSRLAEQALREAREARGVSLLERAKAYLRDDATTSSADAATSGTDCEAEEPEKVYSSWTEVGGPGETSSSLFSWIEEQNVINRATAQKVRAGLRRGGRKNPNDFEIWREFERRRPNSKKSDSALMAEIGRKYGLGRSAAIEACKRGKKLSG